MSWFETKEPGDGGRGDGGDPQPSLPRWPHHREGAVFAEAVAVNDSLWSDTCALRMRYRLLLGAPSRVT
jgi:hypothetical protein